MWFCSAILVSCWDRRRQTRAIVAEEESVFVCSAYLNCLHEKHFSASLGFKPVQHLKTQSLNS